jgi:hypothetical protein
VADNEPGGFIESEVPSLAIKYIRALPHVRYSAVGINLIGFAKCPNASGFLMERFLKTGPWIENSVQPEVVGLRLVYSIDGTRLRLSINPGKSKGPGSVNERDGILVDGNYHKELTSSNLLAEAEAAVSLFQQRCAHFMNFVKIIVGLEA